MPQHQQQPPAIGRLLDEAETARRSAVGAWRQTLLRLFGPGEGAFAEGTDRLGVPERRQFLRLGGSAVLGAAVLAACGSDEVTPPSETGVTEPAPASTTLAPPQTTSPEAGQANDVMVTRTAVSLELVIVAVYEAALGDGGSDEGALALPEGVELDSTARSLASLFRDHHERHAEVLADLVEEMGGDPVTQPNRAILDGLVRPELVDLTTQRAVVAFARQVEDIAASTYGWAAGVLSTPEHRQTVMGIGGVDARHSSALALVLDPTSTDAVPLTFLDTSGPARTPTEVFLQDGQDGDDVTGETPDGSDTEGSGGEAEGEGAGGEGEGGSGGQGETDDPSAGGDSQESGEGGSDGSGEGDGTDAGPETPGGGSEGGGDTSGEGGTGASSDDGGEGSNGG